MTSIEAKPAADGILPVQELSACFKKGFISSATELAKDQIQPASLDLRLGRRAWRIQASFLPGMNQTVQNKIEKFAMYPLDLSDGAVLETGCVYICLLYTSPSPRDMRRTRMPSSA